jgi:tetratricopeptide (TPR) repeat protein
LKPAGAPVVPEEAYWAVRRVLESLARRRPLVLLIDDLQWAEATFIDALGYGANRTHDAPLLLITVSRPELLEVRPGWVDGTVRATPLMLEPLPDAETKEFVRHLVTPGQLSEQAVARILAIAEGNPLFVEELVATFVDDGVVSSRASDGSRLNLINVAIPPTIQALITARLDRLAPAERSVIEAASIEGKEFGLERVQALLPDDVNEAIAIHLRALTRKDIIRRAGSGQDAFRFRHQLIRDAAYEAMPKSLRADLHERFANWLEAQSLVIPVVDELLGYHLERVVQLRRELGAPETATEVLARRASTSLRAAGRRAAQREDPASIALFERALAVAPTAHRTGVLVELANGLRELGDLERAANTAATALDLARAVNDRQIIARASVVQLRLRIDRSKGEVDLATLDASARPLLAELEALGDHEGTAQASLLLGQINADHFLSAARYFEGALMAAERANDQKTAARAAAELGIGTAFGPVPADEGVERCRALRRRVAEYRGYTAVLLRCEALLRAMQGRIEEARALQRDADEIVDDLGDRWASAIAVFWRPALELLAGAPERADATARASLEVLTEMDATNQGSFAAGLLAVALVRQRRHEEALRYADLAAAWAPPDDISSQVPQLRARALVLAERGDFDRAETAARRGMELAERSDDISQRGDALVDLAFVFEAAGRPYESANALRDAIALYKRKGNVVSANRAHERLQRLGPEPGP